MSYTKDQPAGFKNHLERIAVVGAGGHIGSHAVKHLLATEKHKLTALTREGSNTQLSPGLEAVHINYDNHDSLVSSLKNQDALVISLSHMAAGAQDKLLKAAREAGVRWVIPNSYGHDLANPSLAKDLGVIPGLMDAVNACENTGPTESLTPVVTAFWYEFVVANVPGVIGLDLPNRKMTFIDDGNTKINMSSLDQAGRTIANLLSLPILPQDEKDKSPTLSQWRNKSLYTASYLVSQRDILASIQRETGTTDADWTIDFQSSESRYKEGLEAFQSGDILKGMAYALGGRTFFPSGDGYFEEKEGWANEALGLHKEELDKGTRFALKAKHAEKDVFRAF